MVAFVRSLGESSGAAAIVRYRLGADEPDATWREFTLLAAMAALMILWLMWLPGGLDLPRVMGALPWRFEGNRTMGAVLLAAFAVWTILAHQVFMGATAVTRSYRERQVDARIGKDDGLLKHFELFDGRHLEVGERQVLDAPHVADDARDVMGRINLAPRCGGARASNALRRAVDVVVGKRK